MRAREDVGLQVMGYLVLITMCQESQRAPVTGYPITETKEADRKQRTTENTKKGSEMTNNRRERHQ